MSVPRMLPTFLFKTDKTVDEVLTCVRQAVGDCPDQYEGQFTAQHAMISINKSKRHFWSPWMNLKVRTTDAQRHVFVRFSPHPSIWTGFMFGYFSIAVLVCFSVMFGVAQQIAQQSAWAYLLILVGLLIALALWISAQLGQRLADAEMRQIKLSIQKCIYGDS